MQMFCGHSRQNREYATLKIGKGRNALKKLVHLVSFIPNKGYLYTNQT